MGKFSYKKKGYTEVMITWFKKKFSKADDYDDSYLRIVNLEDKNSFQDENDVTKENIKMLFEKNTFVNPWKEFLKSEYNLNSWV